MSSGGPSSAGSYRKIELRREGLPFAEDIPLGIMVEMPSAVMVADHLAKECDFLSIGTNDLIQYSLALDRLNEHVGYLYQPLHPAVLRMIRQTVDAGHACGRSVGICGEMAGDVRMTRLLLGMGLRKFSMHPANLLSVKQVVLNTNLDRIATLTSRILR